MTTPRLEEAIEFAGNPEQRCPCVLLLDTSGSMAGRPIGELNEGLQVFKEDIARDQLAIKRVEIAIVTFDSSVQVVQDFVTVDRFDPPTLTAQGTTMMGTGIVRALDLVETRKLIYRANSIRYYRPWVFMITDGEPQGEPADMVDSAARRIRDEEAANRLAFFAIGVENANMAKLAQIAVRTPLKLRGLDFRELFLWLSASMTRVSASQVGQQVLLPPPGWTSV